MPEEKYEIESLLEANKILSEEAATLRNSNRILRKVNSALRQANDSLRRTHDLQVQNDEMFKRFCNGEFDAPSTQPDESGLLEPGS